MAKIFQFFPQHELPSWVRSDNSLLIPTHVTTAEILYWLPDHPSLLQTFIWQNMDIAPEYPVLHSFLEFWDKEIEGKLHKVRVVATDQPQFYQLYPHGMEIPLH